MNDKDPERRRKVLAVFDVPIHTSAQNVERVLEAGLPVVLSFEVPVCEQCGAMAPLLDEMARTFVGRALIVRVDNTEEGALAMRYHITRVPTLLYWREGKEKARIEGAVDSATVQAHLDYLVNAGPRPRIARGPSIALAAVNTSPPALLRSENGEPVVVTDSTFETLVLHSPLPTLVDFWAPWCGPCRAISPVVEDLGREYAGRLRVAKINTDENPAWASQLGIMGIPTLIFFKQGHEMDRVVGAATKSTMRGHIERVLLSA